MNAARPRTADKRGERGYALLVMIFLATLLLISTMVEISKSVARKIITRRAYPRSPRLSAVRGRAAFMRMAARPAPQGWRCRGARRRLLRIRDWCCQF